MTATKELTTAEKVKAIILDKGYKQYAIAEKTRWNAKKFNMLLNGSKTFYVDYLPEICEALNMSPDEIFNYVPKRST